MTIYDMITSVAARVTLSRHRLKDFTFNSCIHGYAVDKEGRIQPRGVGTPMGDRETLRFSSPGIDIKNSGLVSNEHLAIEKFVDEYKKRDPESARNFEQYSLKNKVETIYRDGAFWVLDHDVDRAYRMKNVLEEDITAEELWF